MPRKLTAQQLAEADQCFAIFSRNAALPVSELGNALRSLGVNPTNNEVKDIIKQFGDPPHLKLDSFKELLTRDFPKSDSAEEIREAFGVFDKDGAGSISMSELKHVLMTMGEKLTEDEVEIILREVEVDTEGNINYDQFIDFMLKK